MSEVLPAEFRDIYIITAEIHYIQLDVQQYASAAAMKIGERLCEAKELLGHGEWGGWLTSEFGWSERKAQQLMQVYREFGGTQKNLFGPELNAQTFADLSYSKLLLLISVPKSEREQFVEENNVAELSTRELDKLIKERDAARRELGDTQIKLSETKDQLEAARAAEKQATERMRQAQADVRAADEQAVAEEKALKEQLEKAQKEAADAKAAADKAKEEKKKAEDKLKAALDDPQVPPELVDKLRAEAEAKAAAASGESEKALAAANARLEELEKRLRLSDPKTAVFKAQFDTLQDCFGKLMSGLAEIEVDDPEKAAKLRTACRKLVESFEQRL